MNLGTGVKVTEQVAQTKSEITGYGAITKADVKVQGVVVSVPAATMELIEEINKEPHWEHFLSKVNFV